MSSPNPVPSSPIDSLRARLQRLVTEPRIRLLPEGPAIVLELRVLVEFVVQIEARLAALERGLAGVHFRDELRCDDS